MFSAPLLTLLLVLSITGSPVEVTDSPTSVPITSRLNFSNGTYNLVANDRARLQTLRGPSKHVQRQLNVPLTNFLVYTISVGIGTPPTSYNLILDSGSAITWVGAGTPYQATPTSVRTGAPVSFIYDAVRSMNGIVYLDDVTVGSGLTVINQAIGVADHAPGFVGFDGVLGIGPVALTLNTLTLTPTATFPTVTVNLVNQNSIPANILGVFFKPYAGSPEETAGQLTFGGTDNNLHTNEITYTRIPNVWPVSDHWGIHQNITYGDTLILPNTVGIVDSGNVLISIATEAFERYRAETGGEPDPVTELLVITSDQYNALRDLNFHIGDETFSLTPDAQIWPRVLNALIGGQDGSIYLIVHDLGTPISEGDCNFINGYVFMQRFYTVFDAPNSRVGFSATEFTRVITNLN